MATIGQRATQCSLRSVLVKIYIQLPIQMAENFYILLKDLMHVVYWYNSTVYALGALNKVIKLFTEKANRNRF